MSAIDNHRLVVIAERVFFHSRWARVVAEEGERSRKAELAAKARRGLSQTDSGTEARSDLGVFELIRSVKAGGEPPVTTRVTGNPVKMDEIWEWHSKGFEETVFRKEIFRRGAAAGEARRWAWEVMLGVIGWDIGLGVESSRAAELRQAVRDQKKSEYERLKGKWRGSSEQGMERDKEEWHRIDVSLRLEFFLPS